jgi:hypothetical protein
LRDMVDECGGWMGIGRKGREGKEEVISYI